MMDSILDEIEKSRNLVKELQLILGLNDSEANCLFQNQSLRNEITELNSGEIIDINNSSNSTQTLLSNAIHAMNEHGGCSINDLYTSLENTSNFVVIKNFDKSPKLECVWDKMKTFGLSRQITEGFDELSGEFKLILEYDDDGNNPLLNYNDDGSFSGQKSDYAITYAQIKHTPQGDRYAYSTQIYNKYFPELSGLDMARFMIHEMLHSEFHRWVYAEANPKPQSSGDFSVHTDLWKDIVVKKYGEDAPTNHHKLMTYFVDEIAHDLWQLNGETEEGNIDNYKYLVYDLFTIDDEQLIELNFLSEEELNHIKSLGNSIQNNIDCP